MSYYRIGLGATGPMGTKAGGQTIRQTVVASPPGKGTPGKGTSPKQFSAPPQRPVSPPREVRDHSRRKETVQVGRHTIQVGERHRPQQGQRMTGTVGGKSSPPQGGKASSVMQFTKFNAPPPPSDRTDKGAGLPDLYGDPAAHLPGGSHGGRPTGGGGGGYGMAYDPGGGETETIGQEFLHATGIKLPNKLGGNSGPNKLVIIGGVAVVGAAAYYFLIHKKKAAAT